MLEILGRIELLLYVPGMRGLSACWLHGDGIFGVGRGWYGWVSIYSVSEGAVHLLVCVNIQKKEVSIFSFHGELYVVVDSI